MLAFSARAPGPSPSGRLSPGIAALSLLATFCAGAGCGSRTGLWALPTDGSEVDAASRAIAVSPPSEPAACADAGSTVIYLVTDNGDLMRFDPSGGSVVGLPLIGRLRCPTRPNPNTRYCTNGITPFSMAVNRTGTAYVVYCDGELFLVNTANAQCQATGFTVPSVFTANFGMGFSQDENDPDETLFVASGASALNIPPTLASIRMSDDALQIVGFFNPPIMLSELTGTGAGDLFAFYSTGNSSSAIAKIDKTTARLSGVLPLPGLSLGNGWAFAFWGGDFYTFTAPVPSQFTVATRVHTDGTQVPLGQFAPGDIVVGAGVSTCAPQQ